MCIGTEVLPENNVSHLCALYAFSYKNILDISNFMSPGWWMWRMAPQAHVNVNSQQCLSTHMVLFVFQSTKEGKSNKYRWLKSVRVFNENKQNMAAYKLEPVCLLLLLTSSAVLFSEGSAAAFLRQTFQVLLGIHSCRLSPVLSDIPAEWITLWLFKKKNTGVYLLYVAMRTPHWGGRTSFTSKFMIHVSFLLLILFFLLKSLKWLT